MLINQAATYRGSVLDRAVNTSSGGFPQFEVALQATQVYDPETKTWIYLEGEHTITGFLILYDSKDQPCLVIGQLEKVFGWDGVSFTVLNEIKAPIDGVQFRVEENEYNDKINFQVRWIDEYNAEPGRTVKKLDADALKSLDARYKKNMKRAPAASAPMVQVAGPKPTVSVGPDDPAVKVAVVKSPRTAKPKPLAPPARTPTNPSVPTAPATASGTTKEGAWATVCKGREKSVTNAQLAEIWQTVVERIAPDKTDEEITLEQWYQIEIAVLDEVKGLKL